MTRKTVGRLGILFALFLVWALWISLLNTRMTTVDVQIDGVVDKVLIYQEHDPQQPVSELFTNGGDLSVTLALRNTQGNSLLVQQLPARYYFVAVKGSETHRSRFFCCSTGSANHHNLLIIHGLDNYESSSQP